MLLFDKWPYRDNSLGGILIDVLLALVVAIFNGMASSDWTLKLNALPDLLYCK